LAGLKVLDLTRVIAGPECTRVLAAHGAQVTRLVQPGFHELPILLADFCSGKTTRELDLRQEQAAFLDLVRVNDVMVVGLRPGALDALGLTEEAIRAANPRIVIARLNAYGWHGPWSSRRGFDSLVQMSGGIAAAAGGPPRPLPAQALDHGAGWMLAAGVARCLALGSLTVRTSLTAMSDFLWQWPAADAESFAASPALTEAEFMMDPLTGCRRVAIPLAQP
jgi:crotonobetainyl-CoA:carnitine CoA-transferase CaiB-like acyl-CoA transferase